MDSGTGSMLGSTSGSTRTRRDRRLLVIGGATALVAVLGLGLSAVLGGADETGDGGVPGGAGSGGSAASSTPGHSPGASQTSAPRSDERRLSLGAGDVPETRAVREVAPGITYTRINRGRPLERADRIGTSTTGPWVVHAVTIDPDVAVGRLATSHGPSLARPETTTDLAEFAGAVVAVNAA